MGSTPKQLSPKSTLDRILLRFWECKTQFSTYYLPKSARRKARNPNTENASLQPDEKVLPVVKLLGVLESIVGWCLSSVMVLLFFTCSCKMWLLKRCRSDWGIPERLSSSISSRGIWDQIADEFQVRSWLLNPLTNFIKAFSKPNIFLNLGLVENRVKHPAHCNEFYAMSAVASIVHSTHLHWLPPKYTSTV